MPDDAHAHRLDLVERLATAYRREVETREPGTPIAWAIWPDLHALTAHLGSIYAWVTHVLTTREKVERDPAAEAIDAGPDAEWFGRRTEALLAALRATEPGESCWTLDRDNPRAGFWARRMVFETARHLADARDAGAHAWTAPPELEPSDWVDGIDEFFEVFLARGRARLDHLPGVVALEAREGHWRWSIDAGWSVSRSGDPADATVAASAGDLALFLWERAQPIGDPRFEVHGDAELVRALDEAPIHL